MKKTKNRSQISLSVTKSETHCKEDLHNLISLDVLSVKVLSFHVPDEESNPFLLNISFFDQLLISNVKLYSDINENQKDKIITRGSMSYDPSDYEKMSLFADSPLTVKLCQFENLGNMSSSQIQSRDQYNINADAYHCNIDILPLFMDTNRLTIEERMEPVIPRSAIHSKSWENLPEIKLCIQIIKNKNNMIHHEKIKDSNFMTITLLGCYNTIIPFDDKYVYTAASKLPLQNEMRTKTFKFSNGRKPSKNSDCLRFYSKWESTRADGDWFPNSNKKIHINTAQLLNKDNVDFKHYLNEHKHTIIWSSFHRSLMLKDTEKWLNMHLHSYQWPLELNICGESFDYGFMGFLDLFKLLYPGETSVQLVVPLEWKDRNSMIKKCGCDFLLANFDIDSSMIVQKSNKMLQSVTAMDTVLMVPPTGGDENSAFVIVEVVLAKPFTQPVIPTHITESDINKMLQKFEGNSVKRKCTGRGQLDYDWESTVHTAATSLRRVPYYGLPDLCSASRQLSVSRIRVEVMTSLWQQAAIYVNNNFLIHEFLSPENAFEEMIMIAHACLMRITKDTLDEIDKKPEKFTLTAARHARQLQDLPHAVQLYLELLVEGPKEPDLWRELSTCYRDVDREWANACISKSIMINPRHPLSLLSKSCILFEEDADAAEPFFNTLLLLYPFLVTTCVCVSAYYLQQEQFRMAKKIIEYVKKNEAEGICEELRIPRAWGCELGDWWDDTPLLPGTNLYYNAADLLLRIRAVKLAEICVARAFTETGESPVYYHLVALCCRLRGQISDALCHLQCGIKKFGEISYLISLQGECYHKQKKLPASVAAFTKIGSCGPYIALLSFPKKEHNERTQSIISDLVRRHPSAYAWITYADYLKRSLMTENIMADSGNKQKDARHNAIACLFKALKYDNRIGRAWATLASLVEPKERRQYCKEMAVMCGYIKPPEDSSKHIIVKEEESFYRLGKVMRECYCEMCENLFI